MTSENLVFQPPQPNTRSDAVKNRALLLDTARQLFEEKGVENVTMSAVAEAAGVGKGTLYRHFDTKAQLAEALLDTDQRELQERTFAHLRQGGQPLDNLHWFADQVLTFVQHNRALLPTDVVKDETLQHAAHWWWRQTIRGLLTQTGASGDLDYMTDVIYIMLDIRTLSFQERMPHYSRQRFTNALHDTINRLVNS